MAERNWTASQWEAIRHTSKNLLISAAAGSGKTATLTRRIIRLITEEGADISRMLIVTFTRAAAAELRSRITEALSDSLAADPKNRHLAEQVCRVRDAMIGTMDSFFLSFVRPMFSEVGLPSDFRTADEGDLASLSRESMEEVLNSFFDGEEDADFLLLTEAFGSARVEDAIDGVLLNFIRELEARCITSKMLFSYAERLESYAQSDPLLTPVFDQVFRRGLELIQYVKDALLRLLPEFEEMDHPPRSYMEAMERLLSYCDSCLAAREDRVRLYELLCTPPQTSVRAPAGRKDDPLFVMFKHIKSTLDTSLKAMRENFFSFSEDEAGEVLTLTSRITRGAAKLTERYTEYFSRAKKRAGLASFSDIAAMAARLLSNEDGSLTEYGESVCRMFDYVFIDEYQDTSPVQDRIFSAVSHNCGRFMVGDIKQSIYAFRGGDPRAFARYRDAWSHGDGGDVIHMNDNFRCSESVIRLSNAVSSYMFPYGGIGFDPDSDLLVHKRAEAEGAAIPPSEICLIEKPRTRGGKEIDEPDTEAEEEKLDSADLEAMYVAKRIRHMLDHETLPSGRRIVPSDIAILGTTGRRAPNIESALAALGIPVNRSVTVSLTERPEVLLLLCILRSVDNPTNDVALAGMMNCAAFGFTLGDIALIKRSYKKKHGRGYLIDALRYTAEGCEGDSSLSQRCRDFLSLLDRYRTLSVTLSVSELIYSLIRDPSVMLSMEKEGDASAVQYALKLYELARVKGPSLYSFLSYIQRAEGTDALAVTSEECNGVSFMTVHKSKGLEFPVCFLINAGRAYFSQKDTQKPLIIDEELGPVMNLPDPEGLMKCDSFLRRIALEKLKKTTAQEQMRLLYVAMTRARDRLIITSVVGNADAKLTTARRDAAYPCAYTVKEAGNHLSLILSAVAIDSGAATVNVIPASKIADAPAEDVSAQDSPQASLPEEAPLYNEKTAALIRDRLDFVYPYEHLRHIPSKLTVSRLYPEILDDYDDGSATLGVTEDATPSVPRFIVGSALSPADAGSAAHVILQFCDFEKLHLLGAGAELCRLRDAGFISDAEAEAAELSYIEKFRHSRLFEDIRSSVHMKREFRFNVAIPAASLTSDKARRELFLRDSTTVIAQGVIDIIFRDRENRLILCDYKTDRLTDYELSHPQAAAEKLWRRHGRQLYYYKEASRLLFGDAPFETLIYSMPLGDTLACPDSIRRELFSDLIM